MKAHILYYSAFGNTRQIADTIADAMRGVLHADAVSVSDFDPESLNAGDLLVVGSPINAWHPTDKIMELLRTLKKRRLDGIYAAAFDTRVDVLIHGDAAKEMTSLLKRAGAHIISKPMPFYVEGIEGPLVSGELERAATWAQTLLTAIEEAA